MSEIVLISPDGNREVFAVGSPQEQAARDAGYVTHDEWEAAHPRPDPPAGPAPTIDDVSRENQRRLDLSSLSQEIERKVATGKDIHPAVLDYRAACVAAYHALTDGGEASIPEDYMSDTYWPELTDEVAA